MPGISRCATFCARRYEGPINRGKTRSERRPQAVRKFRYPFYRVPLNMEEPNSGDAGDGGVGDGGGRRWGIHGVGFFRSLRVA